MQSFWQWFIGEAGAGWIIGILGLIGGIYAWLRRERPPKIVIQEVSHISLLDVHPSQSNRIHVGYSDTDGSESKIESLQQIKLSIYNLGTRDISEAIDLVLTFRRKEQSANSDDDGAVGFRRLVFDDVACKAEGMPTDGSANEQSVRITIPYLNSYRTHHHYAMAYLMTEHLVQLQLVRGSGKGWSARLSTLDQFWTFRRTMARAIQLTALGLICLSSVWFYVELLGSPVYGALYNPTTDNLDRLIALLTQHRESVQAHGLPPVWTRFISELELGPNLRLGWAMTALMISGLVLVYLAQQPYKLATWLTAKSLHIVPPEQWLMDSQQAS